jgi:hypothetical protein
MVTSQTLNNRKNIVNTLFLAGSTLMSVETALFLHAPLGLLSTEQALPPLIILPHPETPMIIIYIILESANQTWVRFNADVL